MALFGKGQESVTKTIAILDVGSGSVGASIAVLDKKGPPTIISQSRLETPIETARTADRLAEQILKASEKGLLELTAAPVAKGAPLLSSILKHPPKSELTGRIEHVAVFLPAPWSQLFLRTIRLVRPTPFKVTTALIERMIADYLAHQKNELPEGEVIEHSALGIRLNGYPVSEISKEATASQIELTIVSITSPKELLGSLRSIIREALGHRATISFHSTNIASSYALSVVIPQASNYILCNGEGELTELLLVMDHIPVATATAPAGCNTILRTLHVHADMARAEAASALTLARDVHSPMAQKLSKTLSSAQRECAESFRDAVIKLVETFGAPPLIYTLGQGSEAQWYADAIANAPYLKQLFPSGVALEGVQYSTLEKYIHRIAAQTPDQGVLSPTGSTDLFLSLETIYADSRFDEDRTLNLQLK